jgi:hypothetical protein
LRVIGLVFLIAAPFTVGCTSRSDALEQLSNVRSDMLEYLLGTTFGASSGQFRVTRDVTLRTVTPRHITAGLRVRQTFVHVLRSPGTRPKPPHGDHVRCAVAVYNGGFQSVAVKGVRLVKGDRIEFVTMVRITDVGRQRVSGVTVAFDGGRKESHDGHEVNLTAVRQTRQPQQFACPPPPEYLAGYPPEFRAKIAQGGL